MDTKTITRRSPERVTQFSVFTANRLGRLRKLTHLFSSHSVHILAGG